MIHEVRMPVLSQSMLQGRVVEWLYKEGDKINKGALLVVVESDKATHELEAPYTGFLRQILVDNGSEVDVNTLLAVITDDEAANIVDEITSPPIVQAAIPVSTMAAATGARKPASPAARRLAQELHIDINQVAGTGEEGLVTEKDIRAFAEKQASIPLNTSEPENVQEIPLTGQRGRIAERMALSRHTAADVTTVMDVDMGRVVTLHSTTQYSYTSYVVWAAVKALINYPLLNAWLMDDRIIVKRPIHIGVAVAIPGALVVPVLRNAELKRIGEIDQEINDLGKKARDGLLTPDDMKGSTFTVTNSGVFGSLFFTPIINLPEVAILGMGKVTDTAVVRQGQVVASKVMYLCLTYDHRAVDGAIAVQFLGSVKNYLENPE